MSLAVKWRIQTNSGRYYFIADAVQQQGEAVVNIIYYMPKVKIHFGHLNFTRSKIAFPIVLYYSNKNVPLT